MDILAGPTLWVSLYVALLGLTGLVLLSRGGKRDARTTLLAPMPMGWVNAGIVVWISLVCAFGVQTLANSLLDAVDAGGDGTLPTFLLTLAFSAGLMGGLVGAMAATGSLGWLDRALEKL